MLNVKQLAATTLLLAMAVAPVRAAEGAEGGEHSNACMQRAYDLAEAAEDKKLPDGTLEKLDGLFNTMEKHCKALEVPEANATAEEIKKIIDGGK